MHLSTPSASCPTRRVSRAQARCRAMQIVCQRLAVRAYPPQRETAVRHNAGTHRRF